MVKQADIYVEEIDIHSLILSPYGLINNYKVYICRKIKVYIW